MNLHTCTTRGLTIAALAAAAVASAAGLSGCRGERSEKPPRQFIPDMDDSPKFRNQAASPFFADQRSMRPRVVGTVAFGEEMNADAPSRATYLRDDPRVFEGFDPTQPKSPEGDPAYEAFIPAEAVDYWVAQTRVHLSQKDAQALDSRPAAMQAMVRRGQERFNIYCSACHGYEAEGSDPTALTGGLVGRRWSYAIPTFHDPKYKDRAQKTGRDGYIFHVIRNGVPDTDPNKPPKMPSYADKINVADAWAVVAYVRALQSARTDANRADAGAAPAAPVAARTTSAEVNK